MSKDFEEAAQDAVANFIGIDPSGLYTRSQYNKVRSGYFQLIDFLQLPANDKLRIDLRNEVRALHNQNCHIQLVKKIMNQYFLKFGPTYYEQFWSQPLLSDFSNSRVED